MRKLTSLTTAAAIVLTSVGISAVPAEARGRHHGGWGHRDRDNISTGDVLGGLLDMVYRFGGDAVLNPALIWRSALVLLAFIKEKAPRHRAEGL